MKRVGLRLLDYAPSSNLRTNPRHTYLLTGRYRQRYLPTPGSDLPEIATVVAAHLDQPKSNSAKLISERLDINLAEEHKRWAEQSPRSFLVKTGIPRKNLEQWVRCFRAPTLSRAIDVIPGTWPGFMLLYTLHRKIHNSEEALVALKLWEMQLPDAPKHLQPELTILALKIAQNHVLDVIPQICKHFISVCSLDSDVLNELLWTIAGFGKSWSSVDIPMLLRGQQILVDARQGDLDAKGYASLGYTGRFASPDVAKSFVDRAPPSSRREFAYRFGKQAIRVLAAGPSAAEVLAEFFTPQPPDSGLMWAVLLSALCHRGLLDSELTAKLWKRHQTAGVRLKTITLTRFLESADPTLASQILKHCISVGFSLRASSLSRLARHHDLSSAKRIWEHFGVASSPECLIEQLKAESRVDRTGAWTTYRSLIDFMHPSRIVLRSLVLAATTPNVVWDGLYAPQRAIVEIKRWVRSEESEINLIYPDEPLLYTYLFMCGRAGYHTEINGFLDWLDRLSFRPTKRLLLALCYFSPQRDALMLIGPKSGDSAWPSMAEFEAYKAGIDQTSP